MLLVLNERDDIEPLLEIDGRLERALAAQSPSVATSGIGVPAAVGLANRHASRQLIRATETSERRCQQHNLEKPLQCATRISRRDTFAPFLERVPRLLDPGARISYDGLMTHGLASIVSRFVIRRDGRYQSVTYVYPQQTMDIEGLRRIVREVDPGLRLTGVPAINHDLGQQFFPQFLKGIVIGTVAVALLIYMVFRTIRHTLLAIAPTAAGFVWSAGVLALLRVELDLFSLFAAVTFVGIAVDYGIYVLYRYVFEPSGGMDEVMTKTGAAIMIACFTALIGFGTLINSSYRPLHDVRDRVHRHADMLPHGVGRLPAGARPRNGTMVTASALIAAFNEEAHVADVVKGTAPHASPVVVVDDGSTDDTAARARAAGAIVIRHEQNRGKGCAIRTGLEYVLKQNCSHVLLLDADLQHDPSEIPRLARSRGTGPRRPRSSVSASSGRARCRRRATTRTSSAAPGSFRGSSGPA